MITLQIVEPLAGGHHTNYLLALAPSIRALQEAGVVGKAVVTITPDHLSRLEKSGDVAAASGTYTWDATLASIPPDPTLIDRVRLFRSVRAAVARQSPDALLCTSADYDVMINAVFRLLGANRSFPKHSVGVMHYGYPAAAVSGKEKLKRLVYELSWRFSSWHRLALVNPIVFECLTSRRPAMKKRLELAPDPVPASPGLSAAVARQRHGLPVDGEYVGFVGMMDSRKAIPELLEAFARLERPAARLLLAGQLAAGYSALVESRYAGLRASGRLIVVDRFLSHEEVLEYYAAVDVHAVLQYRRFNLSANVLKAVASAKPIVVDDTGFTGLIARRFRAGITCDVTSIPSVTSALQAGLAMAERHVMTRRLHRLVEFHKLENFSRVLLCGAIGPSAARHLGPARTWKSVCTFEASSFEQGAVTAW